jgi:hypothetical protein
MTPKISGLFNRRCKQHAYPLLVIRILSVYLNYTTRFSDNPAGIILVSSSWVTQYVTFKLDHTPINLPITFREDYIVSRMTCDNRHTSIKYRNWVTLYFAINTLYLASSRGF